DQNPDPRLRGGPAVRTTAAPAGENAQAGETPEAAATGQANAETRCAEATARREAARETRTAARAEGPAAVETERSARATSARAARWEEIKGRASIEAPAEVPDPVRAELRRHARRVAQLERLRELAVEGEKAKLIEKVDGLSTREDALHERRLTLLLSNQGETAPAAAEAAPAE